MLMGQQRSFTTLNASTSIAFGPIYVVHVPLQMPMVEILEKSALLAVVFVTSNGSLIIPRSFGAF